MQHGPDEADLAPLLPLLSRFRLGETIHGDSPVHGTGNNKQYMGAVQDPGKSKKSYLLICTTFAGGKPLKKVDDAWEYAPIFSE
jgi:hypothetical protein